MAVEIARDYGLRVDEPVPLRSTNNAVAWLAPTQVVAKVGVGLHSRLHTELRVAKELAYIGAPIVLPSAALPAIVYSRYELDVTFWHYHPQSSQPAHCPVEHVAPAMSRLHAALSHISPVLKGSISSFNGELEYIHSLLANPESLPALSTDDRRLLAATFACLKAELDVLVSADKSTLIHGSPHSYNVLLVNSEPCFIDFETVCMGPVEWDIAHLDEGAEAFYGAAVDPRLMWVCRAMASVKTAALCWADIERGDLRDHAEWHLSHIKSSIAPSVLVANDRV